MKGRYYTCLVPIVPKYNIRLKYTIYQVNFIITEPTKVNKLIVSYIESILKYEILWKTAASNKWTANILYVMNEIRVLKDY